MAISLSPRFRFDYTVYRNGGDLAFSARGTAGSRNEACENILAKALQVDNFSHMFIMITQVEEKTPHLQTSEKLSPENS